MSGDGNLPSAPIQPSAPADDTTDEGRRYWKAAIAHLSPEKREAAWEFYLDRLESSAAADTLGGVMLLLEAHLAFFDDLPARLGQAAQQIEASLQAPGRPVGSASSATAPGLAPANASRRHRIGIYLVPSVAVAVGGLAVYAALALSRHPSSAVPASIPAPTDRLLYPHVGFIRVEPWSEPATRRPRGVVVSFGGVAWTERTPDGGAKVYVPSPVEEVRRDLEALRSASK